MLDARADGLDDQSGGAALHRDHPLDAQDIMLGNQRGQRRKERVEFADELKAERAQIAAERELARRESDRFWTDKASSRVYVGMLRAHINALQPPPPPSPPEGYIE